MDIWKLLGIPPTKDIAKIKSAYAKQAKLYHPEEHPEEFKALQNAYKVAVRIAKSQKEEAKNEHSEDIFERKAATGMPETESEPAADMPETEDFTGTSEQQEEQSYDYSDVDPYGDRERFFKQFVLIGRSPYLRNNLDAWNEFLDQKEFTELFADTGFRMNFVRTLCRQSGWRRKTILYFERYLNQFHTERNKPANGKWETKLPCFRIRKLPRLRLPAFCTDRFWGKEGVTFHKKLWSKLSSSLGRELNFDIKADVVRYMKLYLFYGESGKEAENFIEHLHRGWVAQQTALAGIALVICFWAVCGQIHLAEQRKEDESRLRYIRELYGPDSDGYSVEEQKEKLREYNYYWEHAEEGIDDVLERYVNW